MGVRYSAFTVHELEDYQKRSILIITLLFTFLSQELTFFTKKEILYVHKRFAQLAPDEVRADKNAKVSKYVIMDLPELKVRIWLYANFCRQVNPFRDRICAVFSSCQDGMLSFEDFLDMMSVFSDNCPKNLKVEYAFRIYDFDGDDMINKQDLKKVINRLTGFQTLEKTDMDQLINNASVNLITDLSFYAEWYKPHRFYVEWYNKPHRFYVEWYNKPHRFYVEWYNKPHRFNVEWYNKPHIT
ncbi:hypothetical protein NP493_196g00019 [Ridgeia piscesae]|uniref:EF-hand domain-containing protein n=1 Tax=Ridgeia piscesae TaxID=27915 RepID=A0AAD9P1U2_RIDPI|nr:hypothetical protein NP493_196g00019 [Ridgeia piscesae]